MTFLSDYGLEDGFVGICHGVIAQICPQARVIDITHGVPRHDVLVGALLLRSSIPYVPDGIHLAVVDPEVGAKRRAVALRLADDRVLVGPDNGLLSLAAELGGGVVEAVEIAHSPFRLEPVSASFHGRDIFAPVAAQLARATPLAEVGEPCDAEGLVRIELPRAEVGSGFVVAHVLYVDRFGNVQLNVTHEDLSSVGLRLGQRVWLELDGGRSEEVSYVTTFADVGSDEALLYEDAQRALALAVRGGNAAERFDLQTGDRLRIGLT